MTPIEALSNLDNAVSQMTLNRQTHAALMESSQTLKGFINLNTPKPGPVPAALVPPSTN